MKDAAADLSATSPETTTDTGADSQRHTARTRGLATAFGALATMIASACGGSSDANQPTDTAKPTTPPSSTIEATIPTSIDSTTTITVETTTTDAPTPTEQSATTTEAPVVSVDTSSVVAFPLDSVLGRYSATTLLLTGRTPDFSTDNVVSFDLSEPSKAIGDFELDSTTRDQLTSLGYWDYTVSITTLGNDFWLIASEPQDGVRTIASNLNELRGLAATYTQTGGGFPSWVALAEANPDTPIAVVELCASFQNNDGVVIAPTPQAVLLDMTDGIGRIAGTTPYVKVNPDGSRVADPVSPVSGAEC